MPPTARLVRHLSDWTGDAGLYRVTPAYDGNDYVVVWAVHASLGVATLCETSIFAADADGSVTDWSELEGTVKGDTYHAAALARAGYIAEGE